MDSALIAAAIGVAGTVIVGTAGFGAAIWSTRRTIRAAYDSRLWEKRAPAYERAVAALLYRRRFRQRAAGELDEPSPSSFDLRLYAKSLWSTDLATIPDRSFFDRYPPGGGWFEAEGNLLAYATPAVAEALESSRLADDEVLKCLDRCKRLRPTALPALAEGDKTAEHVEPDAEFIAAREALSAALAEAERRDTALINVIRDELTAMPGRTHGG